MRKFKQITVMTLAAGALWGAPALAQDPVSTGVAAAEAVPIVIRAIKPKSAPKWAKFEGTFMHANIVQITVRDKENETSIQTFTLSEEAAAKMQQIIDKGGYQYGDKVTVLYDPQTKKVVKVKGKPSRPL